MAKVKILVKGYDRDISDGVWYASPTVTLVQNKGLNIIVDPGINRKLLLKSLRKEGLKPKDINYVLITHWHVDHFLLMGIFPKAKFLDGGLFYKGDRAIKHKGIVPGTKLKIVATPGHDVDDCSLLVPTRKGTVAIVGDLFWWSEKEEQNTSSIGILINHKDRYVKDKKALRKSRKKILKLADWIIPGHGEIFESPR